MYNINKPHLGLLNGRVSWDTPRPRDGRLKAQKGHGGCCWGDVHGIFMVFLMGVDCVLIGFCGVLMGFNLSDL